jgi:hypothetical protein
MDWRNLQGAGTSPRSLPLRCHTQPVVPNTDDLAYGAESIDICLGSSREPEAWLSGRYLRTPAQENRGESNCCGGSR